MASNFMIITLIQTSLTIWRYSPIDDLDHKGQAVETWVTSGYGGQYIFCVPSLELVVAFTGHNYENGAGVRNLYTMMVNYVLEATD